MFRRQEFPFSRLQAEIDLFCRSGVKEIAVLDPVFNLGAQAINVLDAFAARRFKGTLSLQCRAECVTREFLEAASHLRVRIEFGLQTIHANEAAAIDRNNNLRKINWALDQVQRHNLDHEVSLIFGLPSQTLASFKESVSWCLDRRVPVIRAFPLMLLRGTRLERERDRWSLQDDGHSMPVVIASDSYTHSEWLEMARISSALRLTEGRHPATIGELRQLARDCDPDFGRWQPITSGKAA